MKKFLKSTAAAAANLSLLGLPLFVLFVPTAQAGSEDFIGTVNMTANSFCPRGTVELNGGTMPIQQNSALFSLIGTAFGGDGRNTMGLPDMRGRVPVANGTGPGLLPRTRGEQMGSQTMTITSAELPAHIHQSPEHTHTTPSHGHEGTIGVSSAAPDTHSPVGGSLPTYPVGGQQYAAGQPDGGGDLTPLAIIIDPAARTVNAGDASQQVTTMTGGSVPFDHRAPYIGIRFCMTTDGPYPSRN